MTKGMFYILTLASDLEVANSVKISSNGSGGFDGVLVADDAMFGHSIAALGDVDKDGVPDLAVSASKDDVAGQDDQGTLFLLTLNSNGSVKSSTQIDANTDKH